MQALIDFLTQHPDLALGLVLAAVLLEAVGVDGDHEEPLSVQCSGGDITLTEDARFTGHAVIDLIHGTAQQGIALVLRHVGVKRAAFRLGRTRG